VEGKRQAVTAQRIFPIETEPTGPFPLLIGLEGPPGGGKTYSALRLALGIQRVRKGPIDVIDTEAGRSSVYREHIEFGLVRLAPPYRPSRFLAAIRECIALDSPGAIIVDSLSDEHEGEGGVLEWHEEEVSRRLGEQKDDWRRREAMGQAGWIIPKQDRTRLISSLLRITTPMIFTFRAREKTKPIAQERNGRTVTVPTRMGYQAIAPAEICHAMTCMCLLPPNADGKPSWKTDEAGQDFLLKRPNFLAQILTEAQLDEDTGEKLAIWAAGGGAEATSKPSVERDVSPPRVPSPSEAAGGADPNTAPPAVTSVNVASAGSRGYPDTDKVTISESDEIAEADALLAEAAETGSMSELEAAWKTLPMEARYTLKAALDRRHKPRVLALLASRFTAGAKT
jgi:hypothetical protein